MLNNVELKEGTSLEKHGERRALNFIGLTCWIFTNDIELSQVTGDLSDWVATGLDFLSFLS